MWFKRLTITCGGTSLVLPMLGVESLALSNELVHQIKGPCSLCHGVGSGLKWILTHPIETLRIIGLQKQCQGPETQL